MRSFSNCVTGEKTILGHCGCEYRALCNRKVRWVRDLFFGYRRVLKPIVPCRTSLRGYLSDRDRKFLEVGGYAVKFLELRLVTKQRKRAAMSSETNLSSRGDHNGEVVKVTALVAIGTGMAQP